MGTGWPLFKNISNIFEKSFNLIILKFLFLWPGNGHGLCGSKNINVTLFFLFEP